MYKYYDIIDNKNTIVLDDHGMSNYIDVSYNLPIEFFSKNKKLFDELKKIFNVYSFVSDEVIFNRLEGKYSKDEIYDVIYDHSLINLRRPEYEFHGVYHFVDDFYKLKHPSNFEVEYYLSDMLDIIKILFKLYPNHAEYYISMKKEISRLRNELVRTNKIVLTDDKIKIELPNAWYLTKDGSLYNSMGRDGHKESNLQYPIADIQRGMLPDVFGDFKEKHIEEYELIKERGYITKEQYTHYLNWYGKNITLYQDRIYQKIIVDLVLGIIKAHIDLYEAFEDFEKKISCYSRELDKLFKMTHYQIDDLLIRFVGMSKVKASGLKFVCTTNTYDRDFEEYLARGYRIDLVNPFVVQDGEVIEKDLSDYKKIKKVLGYGVYR